MAFEYRYSLTGGYLPAKDYPIDTTNYSSQSKGDLVKLSSGKLIKAVAGDTEVLGVLEGTIFEGIGVDVDTGQVRISGDAVYEVPYVGATKTTLTDSDIGSSFDIDANQDVNLDDTTGGFCEVVDYDNDRSVAYVRLTNTAL